MTAQLKKTIEKPPAIQLTPARELLKFSYLYSCECTVYQHIIEHSNGTDLVNDRTFSEEYLLKLVLYLKPQERREFCLTESIK